MITIDIVFDFDGYYRALIVISDLRTEFIECGDLILDWRFAIDIVEGIQQLYLIESDLSESEVSIHVSQELEEFLEIQSHYDEGIIPLTCDFSTGKLKIATEKDFEFRITSVVLGKKKWKKLSQIEKYLESFESPKKYDRRAKGKAASDRDPDELFGDE